MKNSWWAIGIITLVGIAFLLWEEAKSLPPTPTNSSDNQIATATADTSLFRSADGSIIFTYPNSLNVSEENNLITLHHEIAYANHPACDFKGNAGTSPTFTDFNLTIQIYNLDVASTAETVSSYLPKENFIGDTLKVSPGFIDPYSNGSWNGYRILEGAEGCGQITYYLPVSPNRTLVLQQEIIGAFSSVATPQNKATILAQPGVITPEKADQIFEQVIGSLKAQ